MKQNLYLKITAVIILVLAVVIGLTACSAKTDIGMVDDLTEDFLDLVLAEDHKGAYELVKRHTYYADFKACWDAMRSSLNGATEYEMEQIGWNVNLQNGATYRIAAFEVELNNGRTLFIRTTLVDGEEGIGGIFFNDITDFNATYGVLATVANIALVGFSLLVIAFTVWMIVDCARRKIKKKPLWIILILLGVTFSVTMGKQFSLKFGLGLFLTFSSVTADPSILSIISKLAIPVGAIIYFVLRKRLTVSEVEQDAENAEITENAEDTENNN